MQVIFNIDNYSELTPAIKVVLDYASGKVQSIDLKDIQTAISELQRVERACEEVSKLEAA